MIREYACFVGSACLALACSSRDALHCVDNTGCPSGHECSSGRCLQSCTDDEDCRPGRVCSQQLCRPGTRRKPRLGAVYGNGPRECPKSPGGFCFHDALIVEGQDLLGASLHLLGAKSYRLLRRNEADPVRVVAGLPNDLQPGTYKLVARNAAGEGSVKMKILQGVPGPDADGAEILARLNHPNTRGRLVVARLPAPEALVAHVNAAGDARLDTTVMPPADELVDHLNAAQVKLSESILPEGLEGPTCGGDEIVARINNASTMTIRASKVAPRSGSELVEAINAATEARIAQQRVEHPDGGEIITRINQDRTDRLIASERIADRLHHRVAPGESWDVDQATFAALCQDDDGCALTLGYTGFEGSPAVAYGPQCRLHIDEERYWQLSPSCLQAYWVCYEPLEDGTCGEGKSALYGPYASANAGRDGDGNAQSKPTVVQYSVQGHPVCFLSDSTRGNDDADPTTGDDGQPGFHFWMRSQVDFDSNGANDVTSCVLLVVD